MSKTVAGPDSTANATMQRYWNEVAGPRWVGRQAVQEARNVEMAAQLFEAAGAAPILVVGTTGDPATPYEWSESLAEQLESGILISRDGDGHTAYNSGNECVDTAIEDYLVDGFAPDGDLSC